jgi:hypothetical protein
MENRDSFVEHSRMYRVDRDGEGGIVCDLDRVEMKDAPTLLIGLGGTGIDALTHTKHAIRRKMKLKDNETVPGRVAFLGIDTNKIQIPQSQVGDTTLSDIEFVDISEMAAPPLVLNEYERDWLSKGVHLDVVGYGASGVRQFGRFMLIHRAAIVVNSIQQAVGRIWGAGRADGTAFPVATTRINVFIFSGVAGGTGSGTFLDMAYLVREAIERGMPINYSVNVYGVLYMPAVNECKINDPAVRSYLPINGYAALKELDFWMNEQRGRKFRQQYTSTITVETNAAPFNPLCFLISPNGSQPADYDRCMKTTGEFIVNILSAPANIPGVQDFDAYIVNLLAMYPNIRQQYSGHYVFASFGMSERRLQHDQVATYIAYYLLHQVDGLFDNTPTRQEVETFYKSGTGLRDACCLRMDMANLERSFNEGMGSNPFGIPVTNMDAFKEAVKTISPKEALAIPMLETMLTNWVGVCETYYHQKRNSVVENRATAMKNAIEILFVDLARGPFYAQKMMHNEVADSVDALKMIEDCIANCRTYIQSASTQFDAAERNARAKKDSAIRSQYIPIIGSARYDEYLEAVYSAYDIKRRLSFAVEALAAYNRLREVAVGVNNNSVGRFTGILRALTDVFHYNTDIITQITVDGATSTWNICNFQQIRNHIDLALQQLEDNGTMRAMVQDFLRHMLEDRETWLRSDGDIGGSLSRFVSVKFSNLMNLSLEQFYMRMFDLPDADALQDHIRTNVLPRLVAEARALFTPNTLYPEAATAIKRTYITYPSTAANIQVAIQSYIQNTRELSNRCDMGQSMRGGSIFMLNTIAGIPMYAFSSIVGLAQAYDAREPVDHHLGRHLKMGDKENWYEFIPSVIPDAAWDTLNYRNPIEAEKNAKARSGFDRGWPKLIAQMAGARGEWVLKKCDKAAYDAVMQKTVLNEDQIQQLLNEGASAAATIHVSLQQVQDFLRQARDFAENGWQNTNIQLMNDLCALLPGGVTTGNLDAGERTPLILRENMIHTPDMADQLREQADLYEALQRLIDAHEKYVEGGDLETQKREMFLKALFYGLYKQTVPKVYQLDTTGFNVPTFVLMSLPHYAGYQNEPFYAMYRHMLELENAQRNTMQQIIDRREAVIIKKVEQGDVEDYEQCRTRIRKIHELLANRREEINNEIDYPHPEVREFYNKAIRFIDENWPNSDGMAF